jgi:YD repeat-containing protein
MRLPSRLLLFLFLTLLALSLPASVRAQEGDEGGAPLTFQYFYDDRGQLIKVVDSTGNVVEYVYDEVGNMLEVNRYTVTGLAIFNFTPQHGAAGTAVTIYGLDFDPNPAGNTVQFGGGVTAVVSAATASTLQVTVPPGAVTGPISVTVGGETAVSTSDFTVTLAPVITSLSPHYVFVDQPTAEVEVTGFNLLNATFAFLPLFNPPALTVTNAVIDPSGQSATLTVSHTGLLGTYTLVATSLEGSSSPIPTPANTLTILDGTADNDQDGLITIDEILLYGTDPVNPDTDGDGFKDGDEVRAGSNPLDPLSTPADTVPFPGGNLPLVSLTNQQDPNPPIVPGESNVPLISIINQQDPNPPIIPGEANSPQTSVENTP